MREELRIYKHNYEERLVADTELFYRREYSKLLSLSSIIEYMDRADMICEEEMIRCLNYIHWSTWNRLVLTGEFIFIFDHLHVFCAEFQKMVESNSFDELTRTYVFVSRSLNGTTALMQVLEKQLNKEGRQALKTVNELTPNNPINYFHAILKRLLKLSHMMTLDSDFIAVLQKACCDIVNSNTYFHPAELIAQYCDLLLTGKEVSSQDGLEFALNATIRVFSLIADKDVFQNIYCQLLAKRIIFQLSISADAEMLMISKLKKMCGSNYTRNMMIMLHDAFLSSRIGFLNKIAESSKVSQLSTFSFHVQVMASTSWFFVPTPDFRLPRELQPTVDHYIGIYGLLYPRRNLKWIHSLCRGEIAMNCFDRPYILQMNTFQMAVLLQFNDQIKWTFQQITDNTGWSIKTGQIKVTE